MLMVTSKEDLLRVGDLVTLVRSPGVTQLGQLRMCDRNKIIIE